MSVFSDVQALYGGLRGTWAKSQAHVVTHVVLVLVVFFICGATFPKITAPEFSATQIAENEWFKLAKDTGVVYGSFVVPLIALAVYAAALRTISQILATGILLVFPPSSQENRFRLVNSWALEPLALALGAREFSLSDLMTKASELGLKYQGRKNDQSDAYQQALQRLTKNAMVYLGDFLVFLAAWIALFLLLPRTGWVLTNGPRFWQVTFILAGLVWLFWFRTSRAVAAVPALHLLFVSTMVHTDPEMASVLQVPEEQRDTIRARLEELLRKEVERTERGPSIRRFIAYRLGFHGTGRGSQTRALPQGIPFPAFYERGSRFSWDVERNRRYDGAWLSDYGAFLYYRVHQRLASLIRTFKQLTRYIVTGAP